MAEPINPEELTIDVVKKWVPEQRSEKRDGERNDAEVNRLMFDGEHWNDGEFWVGPFPGEDDDADLRREARDRVEKAFCSQNVIREVTERHGGGVVGQAPQLGLVADQTSDEDKPEAETEEEEQDDATTQQVAQMMEWWGKRKGHTLFYNLAVTLLLSETAGLRIWVPEGLLVDDANEDEEAETESESARVLPSGLSYEDALRLIHLQVTDPTEGFIYLDPNTQREYSVFLYTVDNEERAEISFLDDEGNTVQGIVDKDGTELFDPVPLGGRLFLDTATRPLFITPQIRQQQNLVNKALTMMSVNLDWSGFLERIFLNAQEPTEEVDDPDNPGKKKLVPAPYKGGANRATFAVGVTTEDDDGNEKVAQPTVVFREPSKPEVFEKTKEVAYRAILHEARQLHALLSGDAAASGDSRIQALSDFIVSLLYTKVVLDNIGLNILSAVHAYALAISKTSDKGLRVSFTTRIDPGPIPADMVRLVMDRVKQRLLSRETGMAMLNTPDVMGELDRIEGHLSLEDRKSIAETIKLYMDAGATILEAATLAGAPQKDLDALAKLSNQPTNGPAPPTPPRPNPDDDDNDNGDS